MTNNKPLTTIDALKHIIYYYPYSQLFNPWNILKLYAIWSILHVVIVQLYKNYCIHYNTIGMIFSPILESPPYCKSIIWTINTSTTTIYYITHILTAFVVIRLIIL